MNELNHPETTKHVILHNGSEPYTYIVVEPQNCLSSGQEYMEVFNTEEEAKSSFPSAFTDNQV